MIYISDKEQQSIKKKMALLPTFMRNEKIGIVFFQIIGVVILSYGTCVGRFLHPIEERKINPSFDFLISCFFYFALSAAAPFSGGHLNPAVTVAISRFQRKIDIKLYIIAQLIGALIGAGLAYVFFDVVPFFYWENVSFTSLLMDCAGQIFGTFVFIFFILLATETHYMAGQYFRYLLIAIMLLAGRIFTLRKGCLNPAIGLIFQMFAAIEKRNGMLFVYSFVLVVGTIIGGLLAFYIFKYVYAPLKQGLAEQKMKISQLQSHQNERQSNHQS